MEPSTLLAYSPSVIVPNLSQAKTGVGAGVAVGIGVGVVVEVGAGVEVGVGLGRGVSVTSGTFFVAVGPNVGVGIFVAVAVGKTRSIGGVNHSTRALLLQAVKNPHTAKIIENRSLRLCKTTLPGSLCRFCRH